VLAHLGGDPTAFDDIVRWYYPALYGHARRNLGDDRLAEDAVQETFLRAYRALPAFAGEYQLGAWLHRIIANVCATEGVRRAKDFDAEQRWTALPSSEGVSPEDVFEQSEALTRVVSAIQQLPESYRDALLQRDVLDLEYAEMADRQGITEDNARARVSRARAALRRMVEGTVAVGALLRRGTRWAPRWAQHVTNSAGAMSDAVSVPARAGALTAVATTGVAVAAVAAVPFFGQSVAPPPPARPTVVVAGAGDGPAGGGTSAAAAAAGPAFKVVYAAPSTTSSTTSSTTTSTTSTTVAPSTSTTTVPAPPVVGVAVGQVTTTTAAAPAVLAALQSTGVATDSNGAPTEASAELAIAAHPSSGGSLDTTLALPATGAPVCSASLSGRFLWGGSYGISDKVVFSLAFTSSTPGPTGTVYIVVGTATVTGGPPSFDGAMAVSGTLTVPATGSTGALDLQFTQGSADPTAPCAAASATSTTAP